MLKTERLILKEITPENKKIFALDSDSKLHPFLTNNPVKNVGLTAFKLKKVLNNFIEYI